MPEDYLEPDTVVPPLGGPEPAEGEPRRWRLSRTTPPPLPGARAKWQEDLGYDPKCEADQRRASALDGVARGSIHNGAWAGDPTPADKLLVRGPAPDPRDELGVHHDPEPGIDDDLPALPRSLADTPLRPRWEAFARLYAYGHSAADAARHAGYAWDSAAQAGWRLLQDDRVRARVAELQRHFADAVTLDAHELCTRAEAIYREAMNRGHYTAAMKAVDFMRRQVDSMDGAVRGTGGKCSLAPEKSTKLNKNRKTSVKSAT